MHHRLGSNGGDKRVLLALRSLLILTTTLLLLPPGRGGPVPWFATGTAFLLLATNFLLAAVRAERLRERRWQFSLVLLDTFLVATALFHAGSGRPQLPVAFFAVLLIAALGGDLARIVAGTTVVAGLFLFLSWNTGPEGNLAWHLLQVPFLYVCGVYYGAAVVRVRQEQEEIRRLEAENRRLESLLNVTNAAAASVDLGAVLQSIVRIVAGLVDAVRCSIVILRGPDDRWVVMATSDDPGFAPLVLDPAKYPEFRKARETGQPVVIGDVAREPMLAEFRAALEQKKFRSLLVIPLRFRDEFLGVLSIRADRPRREFSAQEVTTCRVAGNACANALKNALLFDRALEEARVRRETSEILQSLMAHSPDVIFLADSEGNLTDLSTGGEALLGIHRDQVAGRRAAHLFFGSELPLHREALEPRGGTVSNLPVLLRGADGELRHGIASFALLRDAGGIPNRIVGICKDLTDLKRAQGDLQHAQKASTLERIAEMVNAINDPLAGVVGYAQLLLRNPPDPKTEAGARRILQASRKCQTVIANLLSFSHRHALEQEPQAVHGVLNQALEAKAEDLRLPVHPRPPETAPAGRGGAPSLFPQLRILAVDDEPVVLELLRDFLKLHGHTVDTATTGKEALEKAGKYPYDAVLLDLRLPDLHGTEVFRRLRRDHPKLAERVIFNSVDTFLPEIREFIGQSGNRSIQKPFNLEDLDLAIASLPGREA
ncbi:MAG: response regulator [Acidobacteria bacterium]|nr:response regulator [Acidobacteriota bacterium]